jgi:hypothetical protein
MLSLSDDELSLVNDILCFVCDDRRSKDFDCVRMLGRPRDDYVALLRRVQERLDLRAFEAYVEEFGVALWVEAIAFDDQRGRTVLSGPDFHFDLERTTGSPAPRGLLALRSDDRIRLPGVYVASSHRFGVGRAWVANVAPEQLPEPPLLLTNDEGFRSVFRGRVSFRLSPWARQEFARYNFVGRAVPVEGDGWFGIIRVDAGDRARGHFEAFSREVAAFTAGERTVRWAGEDQEFGQILIGPPGA